MKKGIYKYPYVTVEELRRTPGLLEVRRGERGGARFEGPTDIDLAFRYFSDKEKGKYLECGPVFGKFLKVLQDAGYKNIYALDFADMLHFPDRSKLRFDTTDFNKDTMPYPDNYFDGIAAWGFGEHLENPHHNMRELHRVLKPGGTLLYSLPNVSHISSRLFFLTKGVLQRWHKDNNHIAVFTRGIFEKTFLRYFDLEKTEYKKIGVKLPPYWLFKIISRYLPESELFGDVVHYVFKKKPFVPYTDVIER